MAMPLSLTDVLLFGSTTDEGVATAPP